MDKKIIIGIIGAGMIAEQHVKAFKKQDSIIIKWVSRRDKTLLNKFKQEFNIPYVTTNYKEILDDKEVDLVIISTPPQSHHKMFIESLEAGKHVLLEKPAAINMLELQDMIKVREKYPKLIVSTCSARHSRLQPKFRLAKQIIDSGKLGEVYYIHHNSNSRQGRPGIEYNPTAKWFLNKEMAGGGPAIDWGAYDLSFHLGLLSDKPQLKKIESIFLKSGLDNYDVKNDIYDIEEHFVAMMKFTNGLKYYWERASHANVEAPNESRIYGTKGGLKLSFYSWDKVEVEFFDIDENGKARKEIIKTDMSEHVDDHTALAEHIVEVIKGNTKPLMPLELEAKHLDIIFRLYDLHKKII